MIAPVRTTETFMFEGTAPLKGESDILGFYQGMTFDNVGTLDKNEWRHSDPQNGYTADGMGHDLAFTYSDGGSLFHSSGETFSLKTGQFASAWETGEQATFSAYKGGVLQGSQTVSLDQTKSMIHFSSAFMHIDQVMLTVVDGGAGINGSTGNQLAMDNLKVVWDGGIPSSGAEPFHHPTDMLSQHAHLSGEFLL